MAAPWPVGSEWDPKPGALVPVELDDNHRVVVRILPPGFAEHLAVGLPVVERVGGGYAALNAVGAPAWARNAFLASVESWEGFTDDDGLPLGAEHWKVFRLWTQMPTWWRLRVVMEALVADFAVRSILTWLCPLATIPDPLPEVPDVYVEPTNPARVERGEDDGIDLEDDRPQRFGPPS